MIATSCCASARASTTASPAASMRSRRARRRSTSTSIRPRSTRTSTSTCRSSATPAMCSAIWCRCSRRRRRSPTSSAWWQEIAQMARAQFAVLQEEQRYHHAAICDPAAVRGDRGRDTYITTEVGQHQMWAAQFFGFEEPHRWMTSGGLGTMGYGLPAALGVQVAHPRQPRDRHRRRRLGADDDAGDVDGRSVRTADQDLHPEQPVHGHGAAVAAAAARQPAVAFLLRGAAGFRQARRRLWLRRPAGDQARRSRRRDQGDDQASSARCCSIAASRHWKIASR